ncbi:MAG: hypothetical protein AAGD43_18315 [Pseudomonadota bacterium]
MPKRTSLKDAARVENADDLDDVVRDKREGWRATAAKARRRQRRYSKQMTNEIARLAQDDTFSQDE